MTKGSEPGEEWVTGTISAKVKGIPLNFELTVPAVPVKPQRMLPIFQQMTNAFVGAGIEKVEAEGKSISCKAGCGACCDQAVPLAESEIYHIAALVENMPEPKRSAIRKKFSDGAAHFHKIGWFERFRERQLVIATVDDKEEIDKNNATAVEYFEQGISCPFLEDNSCSIHPDRPIACREYLVTSPAENCSKLTGTAVRIVDLMIKPSRTLRYLGRTGRLSEIGMPIMIRALELAEQFPDEFAEKTGPEWMKDFFDELSPQEPD